MTSVWMVYLFISFMHSQTHKYYCDESDSQINYNILVSNRKMHDCGPNALSDDLVYYCCDGIARYCLSGEPDCFWANNNCPSQYKNYTCHIPTNSHCSNHLLASMNADPYYDYYCNHITYQFYASLNRTLKILDSPLSQLDKYDLLMHFNALRLQTALSNSAADMNYLFWDNTLALLSQDSADKCEFTKLSFANFFSYHSKYSQWTLGASSYGFASRIATPYSNIPQINNLTSMVTNMYNVHLIWSWSELRYFGCGYQICPANSTNFSIDSILMYCATYYTELFDATDRWIQGTPCS
eukprot:17201_1